MGLKKRINIQYMLLTLLAIIATVAISSVVFYELIKKEVVGDLKTYTDLMVDSDAWKIVTDPDDNSMESALQNNNSHLRITFVDASGKALYDTNADVGYMEKVWSLDYEGESRTLDVHIKTLRQKLGVVGCYIKTVRNVGYYLDVDDRG